MSARGSVVGNRRGRRAPPPREVRDNSNAGASASGLSEAKRESLSKLLSWVLRHGFARIANLDSSSDGSSSSEGENSGRRKPQKARGLEVYRGGFVALEGCRGLLRNVKQLARFTRVDVLEVIRSSKSQTSGATRFELIQGGVGEHEELATSRDGEGRCWNFVRARYGVSVPVEILESPKRQPLPPPPPGERNGKEHVARVGLGSSDERSLFRLSLDAVCENISLFESFEGAPPNYVGLLELVLLELKDRKKLNNTNLRPFLVPEMRALDLRGDMYVSDGTLNRIGRQCPNLIELQLTDAASVTDSMIKGRLGKLKQLEKLVVEHAKYVSDDGLENIREGLPRLRTLGLSGNELVTINGVTRLVENSRITTLVLERCTNLRPIDAVIKEIQRLRPGIAVHIS